MPGELLYKFRNWNDPFCKKCLLEQEIYFASPKQFNDPFDCSLNIWFDELTKQQKIDKYYKHIKERSPHKTDKEIIHEAENMLKEGLLEKEAIIHTNEKIIAPMTYQQVGVLSFSKNRDHILLWSHYADNHQGICIGYNKEILLKLFESKYNTIKKVFVDVDVDYQEQYPTDRKS